MSKRRISLIAAAAITLSACGGEFPGSLEPVVSEPEVSGFGDFRTSRDKSFGIFVCTDGGAVELETIEPISSEGGIEFLGAEVYTSPDMFVGAANGFPADGLDPDRLEPLEEAVIESDCEDPDGENRVQLIVGAERTSVGGGKIEGIRVSTSGGDVDIDYTILLCGDALEFCEILTEDSGA